MTTGPTDVTRTKHRRSLQKYIPYFFISPFFALFLTFMLGPILFSFYMSLTTYSGTAESFRFVGLANYFELSQDPLFILALRNTVVALAIYETLLLTTSLFLALVANMGFVRFKSFFRTGFIAPFTLGSVPLALMFSYFYEPDWGTLNNLLALFALPHNFRWLVDPSLALVSVVLMRTWWATGYYCAIFTAGLQAIPQELYEAATIDGAGLLRRGWAITLPMMKPIFFFAFVMSSLWVLQMFTEPWILTEGGPLDSTLTIMIYMYRNAFRYGRLGYGAAISYILTLIMIVFSIFQVKWVMKRAQVG